MSQLLIYTVYDAVHELQTLTWENPHREDIDLVITLKMAGKVMAADFDSDQSGYWNQISVINLSYVLFFFV